jgi:hypothetical protein
MADIPKDFLGKKVFFLYPQSVIQKELVVLLIQNEYEVYLLHDHRKALGVLKRYNDSIIFINIDEALKEAEWETYIKGIMSNEDTKNVRIGIISYNTDKALAGKYLMDLMVQCGFIRLTLGIKESAAIILKALDANEAKGRRKYIRAKCTDLTVNSFNIRMGINTYKGRIRDISSVGMACVFDEHASFELKTPLNDIQLNLKGLICSISGVVAGIRTENEPVYLIMFDHKITEATQLKISNFIFKCLQETLAKE